MRRLVIAAAVLLVLTAAGISVLNYRPMLLTVNKLLRREGK